MSYRVRNFSPHFVVLTDISDRALHGRPTTFTTRPALLLDLDGTVRYSRNGTFINAPEDVALFDGVEETIQSYRDDGYVVGAVSNQGGVAFGHKDIETLKGEVMAMHDLFEGEPFDVIQMSPFHEEGTIAPFCQASMYRKPNPGMVSVFETMMYARGVLVDWEESIMVGDREEDFRMADRVGLSFEHADLFFGRKTEAEWRESVDVEAFSPAGAAE